MSISTCAAAGDGRTAAAARVERPESAGSGTNSAERRSPGRAARRRRRGVAAGEVGGDLARHHLRALAVAVGRQVGAVRRRVATGEHLGRPVPRPEVGAFGGDAGRAPGSTRSADRCDVKKRVIFGHQMRCPGPIVLTRCMIAVVGARDVAAAEARVVGAEVDHDVDRVPALRAPRGDPVRRPSTWSWC